MRHYNLENERPKKESARDAVKAAIVAEQRAGE